MRGDLFSFNKQYQLTILLYHIIATIKFYYIRICNVVSISVIVDKSLIIDFSLSLFIYLPQKTRQPPIGCSTYFLTPRETDCLSYTVADAGKQSTEDMEETNLVFYVEEIKK